MILIEVGLSRVFNQFKDGEFAMISGYRENNTPDQNTSANISLKNDVRALGLGYVTVEAMGEENQVEGEPLRQVNEISLYIPNRRSNRGELKDGDVDEFFKSIMDLGKKYQQTCILYAKNGKAGLYNCTTGDTMDTYTDFKIGTSKYFRGRVFHLESLRHGALASTWMNGLAHQHELITTRTHGASEVFLWG